jgi:integrase
MAVQAGKLATGADIKKAKPGAKLRFGSGLYLLIGATGIRSWQVHYDVNGKHQATIVGRWPELGVVEAKARRDDIRRTVREGGDPAHERHERRQARRESDAATVRVVGEAWMASAKMARKWSDLYVSHTGIRMAKHVYPVLGDRPIGRVTAQEVEALIIGLTKPVGDRPAPTSQSVHVRQNLQSMFDYALRRDLVTINPVRKIADDLPKRATDEVGRAHVETIEEARAILRAVDASKAGPFARLAHRLIALTAVRKMEGIGARWSEITEGADGMTWSIPGVRMKGRRGAKRDHVIPLAPQAADVFRAARALQDAAGIRSDFVFPGPNPRVTIHHSGMNWVMQRVLTEAGMKGRHTVHGWRATFSTLCNEADPGAYRVIDVMLAHKTFAAIEARYNKATFLAERRKLACIWADRLLDGAPTAAALVGLEDNGNVVQLRRAA